MGFFGRLFGKNDFDVDSPLPGENKMPQLEDPFPQDNLGLNEKSPFPEETPRPHSSPSLPSHLDDSLQSDSFQQHQQIQTPLGGNRDLELINSKLDTLKAILNSMDQRIANLERAAGVEEKKMPW